MTADPLRQMIAEIVREVLDGRLGASEVFNCTDPWSALAAIGAALQRSR